MRLSWSCVYKVCAGFNTFLLFSSRWTFSTVDAELPLDLITGWTQLIGSFHQPMNERTSCVLDVITALHTFVWKFCYIYLLFLNSVLVCIHSCCLSHLEGYIYSLTWKKDIFLSVLTWWNYILYNKKVNGLIPGENHRPFCQFYLTECYHLSSYM